jgi:hypothetical protein
MSNTLLAPAVKQALEKSDWYANLKNLLNTETNVSFALYKKISDKWTTLMGKGNPLPFSLASLSEGLPVPGGSVTDVLPGLTMQDMFSIEVPTSEMRDLFTVYQAQKECETAMGGDFLSNNYRQKLTQKIDLEALTILSGLPNGNPQSTTISIVENRQTVTIPINIKKSEATWQEINMTNQIPGGYVELLVNPTDKTIKDPSTRDAAGIMGVNFLNTGRVYCGNCWLCGFPVWCYFGKEVLPDGEINNESVIYTSCGECEHKGAVWPSVISFMLARIQQGSTVGKLAYGNSHVKCNQDKERMVGFRWNGTAYKWEVEPGDIRIIVDTILDEQMNEREYDVTLGPKLQTINDSRGTGDTNSLYNQTLKRIEDSYQQWVTAANGMLRTESEMKMNIPKVEMADRWLCRMTYCFAEEYGLAWLTKLAKLNEKAYKKKEAALTRRLKRAMGSLDKKEQDKHNRALAKLKQGKEKRQEKISANRRGGAAFKSIEVEDVSDLTEVEDVSDLTEKEKLIYKKIGTVFDFLLDIYEYDIPDMDTKEYEEEYKLYEYSALNKKYNDFMSNETRPKEVDYRDYDIQENPVESVFGKSMMVRGGSRKTLKKRRTKRTNKKSNKKNTKRRNRKH